MKEAIEFIQIHFANGREFTISGNGSQQAMQDMLDAFWSTMGADYQGDCLRVQSPLGGTPNVTPTVDYPRSYEVAMQELEGLRKASDQVFAWQMWRHGGPAPTEEREEALVRWLVARFGLTRQDAEERFAEIAGRKPDVQGGKHDAG